MDVNMLKFFLNIFFVLFYMFCFVLKLVLFCLQILYFLSAHFFRWIFKKFGTKRKQVFWPLPPPKDLLNLVNIDFDSVLTSDVELEKKSLILIQKLASFGIDGKVVSIQKGTLVDLFEFLLTTNIKVSKILALENDLVMVLKSSSVRILAPIPGKNLIGFEVAKKKSTPIYFANVLRKANFSKQQPLKLFVGQKSDGSELFLPLVEMPHLLIAGSTGSGKSVCIHSLIASLLFGHKPDEMKLILIDPKQLEFAFYKDLPHLLFPVIVEIAQVVPVLSWLVQEMMDRYQTLSAKGYRDLGVYNALEKNKLPYIVVVIDELADLIMVAGKSVEHLLIRLAQMARAAGIHLIVATQRPSVDVVTGLIKVNFPTRIAFRVSSKIDSRVILDVPGAEKLLGKGDMLFLHPSQGTPIRLTGSFISAKEIEKLTFYLRKAGAPNYICLDKLQAMQNLEDGSDQEKDILYDQVLLFLKERDEISISLIQRKFKIGFNRAARIIEILEEQGVVGGQSKTSKSRKIL